MKVFCDSSLNETAYCIECAPPCVLGHTTPVTVNQGEYISVIRALNMCFNKGYRNFTIYTDSQLVVRQVNARIDPDWLGARYKTKNKKLYELGTYLVRLLKECQATLEWIPREENPAGIELEKIAKGKCGRYNDTGKEKLK